jgi:hypothetical protein
MNSLENALKEVDQTLNKAALRIGELLVENERLKRLVKRGAEMGYIGNCEKDSCLCEPCKWSRDIKQAAGIPL